VGKSEAGTKGEGLVKLTIRHDDRSDIAYRLPFIAVGESIRAQKAQDSETAIIHWRAVAEPRTSTLHSKSNGGS
jgi:hypothetical protein